MSHSGENQVAEISGPLLELAQQVKKSLTLHEPIHPNDRQGLDSLRSRHNALTEAIALTKRIPLSLEIRLERHDEIPAFGAFIRCEEQHDSSPVVYLNVQACMMPEMEDESGGPVPMSREDRKRLIISSLMHEFGHALESHFRLPVNEDAIEAACANWESVFEKSEERAG